LSFAKVMASRRAWPMNYDLGETDPGPVAEAVGRQPLGARSVRFLRFLMGMVEYPPHG